MAHILSTVNDGPDNWICIMILLLACGYSQSAKPRWDSKIHPQEDAMKYLVKYGYLDCFPRELRFRSGLFSSKPECSKLQISEATRKLQHILKIPQTGDIDKRTFSMMRRGRCGDKDTERRTLRNLANPRYRSTLPGSRASPSDGRLFMAHPVVSATVLDKSSNHSGRARQSSLDRSKQELLNTSQHDADDNSVEEKREDLTDSDESSTRVRRDSISLMADDDVTASSHQLSHHRFNSRPITISIMPVEDIVEEDSTETMNRMRRKIMEKLKEETRQARREKREIFQELSDAHKRRILQRRKSRKRRSTHGLNSDSGIVYWSLPKEYISRRIAEEISLTELNLAFMKWSRYIPLRFRKNPIGVDAWDADIEFQFSRKAHGDNKPFDGTGGELAHSQSNGREEIHFDDDEFYQTVMAATAGAGESSESIDLQQVAVHEIGHVLGLDHTVSADGESVMDPIYHSPGQSGRGTLKLSELDVRNIQAIHGICKGSFDSVIDWLEVRYDGDPLVAAPIYKYSTYFYRDDHFWKYENRYHQTLPDHPKQIAEQWRGIPSKIDAITQVPIRCSSNGQYVIDIKTYIFKGDSFYLYDSSIGSVAHGYPKRIADHFGSRDTGAIAVPDNLDAVYYDFQMNELYFFKGKSIWIYDACLMEQNSCCMESAIPFTDHFTMHENSTKQLTGYIDSVHYSYDKHRAYLIQGDDVYEMHAGNENGQYQHWRLLYVSAWYDIWHDICDVT